MPSLVNVRPIMYRMRNAYQSGLARCTAMQKPLQSNGTMIKARAIQTLSDTNGRPTGMTPTRAGRANDESAGRRARKEQLHAIGVSVPKAIGDMQDVGHVGGSAPPFERGRCPYFPRPSNPELSVSSVF